MEGKSSRSNYMYIYNNIFIYIKDVKEKRLRINKSTQPQRVNYKILNQLEYVTQ